MKIRKFYLAILFLNFTLTITGCSGGSGGDSGGASPSTPRSPIMQVLPVSFDFGLATTNNSPAPLQVRIKNNGNATLQVHNIVLSDQNNFSLNTNGGSRPCGSISPGVPSADYCTFEIGFLPGTNGSFSANVLISSNDGGSPFTLAIIGISEPVANLTVRINQIETSCPSDLVNAYVSVIDQGGYSLSGLTQNDFTVTEDLNDRPIASSHYVETIYEDIAIAAVMDYSGSLTDQPEAVADMENGFKYLFNGFKGSDVGEIVKFDSGVQVVQAFTSDTIAITNAISALFDMGRYTRLYDAVFQAVDDTGLKTNYRRAVVVATDGKDEGDTAGVPISTRSLTDVINNATGKGVPIFTIGIGNNVNRAVLEQMANDTGGQFFEAITSQNLATVYQQLNSVLYQKQYILTFNQLGGLGGATANLTVEANSNGISGNDTRLITSCP